MAGNRPRGQNERPGTHPSSHREYRGPTDDAPTQLVEKLQAEGYVYTSTVTAALGRVPRERFVPESMLDRAYDDVPLDIGVGQTISAPQVVDDIAELLDTVARQRLLSVSTGTGHHAAVIAAIVGEESTG